MLIFLLLLPIDIYLIGDYLGAGVAFPLFKYQITYLGTSIITGIHELGYVIVGTYHHRTAISVGLWSIADILMICGIILFLIQNESDLRFKRLTGLLIFGSGIFFLSAIIAQYGPVFQGPAGTAIPIGLPVLFIIGGWLYLEGSHFEEKNDEESPDIDED